MYSVTVDKQLYPFSVGKAVCVGRNYAAHAKELNNAVPSNPILFHKPANAVCALSPSFSIPNGQGEVHHELEIAVLISTTLSQANESECRSAIAGLGLALDLTLRDVQTELKSNGQPWEMAKSFDNSCPITDFISINQNFDLANISIQLERNGAIQQQGNSKDMLFPIVPLISYISKYFTLNPGDIVLTGTPAGVGPLVIGDSLKLKLADQLIAEALVK